MNISAIAFTEQGLGLGKRLQSKFPSLTLTRCQKGMLEGWTQGHFQSAGVLLFIGAAGIAVRAIAPHVRDKTADPAVIVMDELGRFVIPILSGHLGGANRYAEEFAGAIGALSVITTATDLNNVFAVDVWAKQQGLLIANPECIKLISSRILCGESIRIKSLFPIEGAFPGNVVAAKEDYDILVTYRTGGRADALKLIAPAVTLGIGCKKGVPAEVIEHAFELTLKKAGCHPLAVCGVASIDIKKEEKGILQFCSRHGLAFHTFSAAQLSEAEGSFSSSAFVQKTTGVDNVCERAAVLAGKGRLLTKKDAGNGVTMALAISEPVLRFKEEE